MRNLASFSTSVTQLWANRPRLKMQQDIRTMKRKCNAAMIVLCPRQVWWSWVHAPLKKMSVLHHPYNWSNDLERCKRAKSSITQAWFILLRWNFVQSLNAWQSKCRKSSRSRGRGHSTTKRVQKMAKSSIIRPRIARFHSNFVQTLITWRLMYHELSRSTDQRSRSQRDITYQH